MAIEAVRIPETTIETGIAVSDLNDRFETVAEFEEWEVRIYHGSQEISAEAVIAEFKFRVEDLIK